jgi:phenylalanyl-tRNA synthetase alpha chain
MTDQADLTALRERIQRIPGLDAAALEAEQIALLGRKSGAITELLRRLPSLPPQERRAFGAEVNELKVSATGLLDAPSSSRPLGASVRTRWISPCPDAGAGPAPSTR